MLNIATTMDAATTGVKEIASALGGGIREGSLVIIEGEARSGKSILSQHVTHGILRSRESAIAYYTLDQGAEELIAQMDSVSLDVMHDFVTDRFRIYTVGSSNVLSDAQKSLRLLISHISELPERFKLVVVDSVTPLMNSVSSLDKMDFFQSCKELCDSNRTIILVADTHVFDAHMLPRVYLMSDYYLKLRSRDVMLESGMVDERDVKTLQVTKLAGAERYGNEGVKFEIKPRVGIQILPFVTVKA